MSCPTIPWDQTINQRLFVTTIYFLLCMKPWADPMVSNLVPALCGKFSEKGRNYSKCSGPCKSPNALPAVNTEKCPMPLRTWVSGSESWRTETSAGPMKEFEKFKTLQNKLCSCGWSEPLLGTDWVGLCRLFCLTCLHLGFLHPFPW